MTNDEYQEAIADMVAHDIRGGFMMPSPLCEICTIPEGARVFSYDELRELLTARGLPKTLIIRANKREAPKEA